MIVTQTDVKEFPCKRGKVRDVYDIGNNELVIVATDRISAFDWVLSPGIPEKGRILTEITCFWLNYFSRLGVSSHLLSTELITMPKPFQSEEFVGRTMLVEKHQVIPMECIVRGYLSGSGYKEYTKTGKLCGHDLPKGLLESTPLGEPLFTPSTKAEQGHDVNISVSDAKGMIGNNLYERIVRQSLFMYVEAAKYAWKRGIIIADTKFEFGGNGTLIDEVLTPDSSRYWPVGGYCVGSSPASLDKQHVRDYLDRSYYNDDFKIVKWDKNSTPPELPEDLVKETTKRYETILQLLTTP